LIRGLSIDKKTLIVAEAAMAALAAYRFYDYWTTGFFVSDEFGYYYFALHGGIYSDRWFVGAVNIVIFRLFGITNVDAFSYLLPFYLLFWTGLTFFIVYKLLRLLSFDERTVALSIASSFVLISFVLLSLGFLTEPVGLCMAMAGVYFLAKFMKAEKPRGALLFPFLSACFFGFAAGTREPYNAFLLGGVVIVALVALARRGESGRAGRLGQRTVIAASILVFLFTSLFFLFVPTQAYFQQVAPISGQIAQSIISNPVTSGRAVTSTVTAAVTEPVTVTTTVLRTTSNVVTTAIETSITNTTSTATSTIVSGPTYPFYKEFVLTNMLLIFLGGIALGWGPICLAVGVLGFFVLLRTQRQKDLTRRFMFLAALIALGSYLVVSFIYAPDPTYFSFSNYSTLIRFSDTALPAYFLLAPFFLAAVARTNKRVAALGAICVAFLLVAVPVYQVYAASNFNFTSGNPFQAGYRTDAAQVRDYLNANLSGTALTIVGVPYGWTFTPGVQDLHAVKVYDVAPDVQLPYVTEKNFTTLKAPNLLIFDDDTSYLKGQAPWIVPFLNGTLGPGTVNGTAYAISSSRVLIDNSAFKLVEDQVSW